MSNLEMVLMVLAMAGVTYLIRMIPLTFFTKKITNKFLRSLLFYIPYAVLSSMTFPAIFYSTGNFYTALAGTIVAIVLALFKRSLLLVACCAVATCLITGLIIL